jgi:hypothetical protein
MEEGTQTPIREDVSIQPKPRFVFHSRHIEDEAMKEGKGSATQTALVEKKENAVVQPFYVSSIQTFETCGYFTGTFRRSYPTREKPSKLVVLADNRAIKIVPTQEYGYPNAHDLDFKRALFRIIDEQAERVERVNPDGTRTYHYRVPTPLAVQSKTLIRYAGRSPKPRERKLLNEFLHRNAATRMHGEIEDPKTREFKLADVALFSEVITRGTKLKEGIEAESHLIFLTPFAIRCYYWHRTRQEDISFHNQLTQAYAKVIYPYLDSGWFASYSRGGRERTKYQKTYSSVCHLLDLSKYKFESDIRRHLDPGHEELNAAGYLARWEYYQRADKEWVISWYPGSKWFLDKEARERREVPRIENKLGQGIDDEQEAAIKQLVEDILSVFHDEHSRDFYFLVARRLPHHEIRDVIKATEYDTMIDPSRTHVDNPAAIFTNRLIELAERHGITLV